MSASLLRGLRVLEVLGHEPLGVSALARRLGVDKAGMSRMLAALHSEGWVLRTGARYVLGPRALGLIDSDPVEVRVWAGEIACDLFGQTGLSTSVVRLAGSVTQPVAVAADEAAHWLDPPEPFEHLWSTAGGLAVLAQLPDPAVDRLLAVDPWPPHAAAAPDGPDAVRELVRAVRGGATAEEYGWTIESVGCIALPWPLAQPAAPHAVLVLGDIATMRTRADELRGRLRDAVAPG